MSAGDAAAKLLLQVPGAREGVSVRVCFENPLDREAFGPHVGKDLVRSRGARVARLEVLVEDGIDDRGRLLCFVRDDYETVQVLWSKNGRTAVLAFTVASSQSVDKHYIH